MRKARGFFGLAGILLTMECAPLNAQVSANDTFVTSLYVILFNSLPDSTGWIYWTGLLNSGYSQNSVVGGFLGSPQWAGSSCNTTNHEFVNCLYQYGLKRAPDSMGAAYWEGVAATDRVGVIESFITTQEFVSKNSVVLTYRNNYSSLYDVSPTSNSSSPGQAQTFHFHYTDPAGVGDIGYGYLAFSPAAGGPTSYNGCQIEWDPSGALNLNGPTGNLYGIAGSGPTLGPLPYTVCSMDPALSSTMCSGTDCYLTVSLTFTSSAANQNYGIWSFGTTNVEGLTYPTGEYGTWSVRSSQPSVQLTVPGVSGTTYHVGDTFTLSISGAIPNSNVSISQNGAATVNVGSTDGNGRYSVTGLWRSVDAGSYAQTWYVGGNPIPPSLSFTVSATISSGTTSGTPPPPDTVLPTPDTTPPSAVSGSYQACTEDISGAWSSSVPGLSYSISQLGQTLSGSALLHDAVCGDLSATLTGTKTADSVYSLQFLPHPGANFCGTVAVPSSGVLTLSGCSTGTVLAEGGIPPSGVVDALTAAGNTNAAATLTWTRTSTPPGVSLTFDLYNGRATTALTGIQKAAGPLSISLSGAGRTIQLGSQQSASGGNSYNFTFARSSLISGDYTSAQASWDGLNVSVPVRFRALGQRRLSQYNTPDEKGCNSLTQEVVWVFDGGFQNGSVNCSWTKTQFDTEFAAQARTNGTGRSVNFGLVKNIAIQGLYRSACGLPAGATTSSTFVTNTEVIGSCLSGFSAGKTVAVSPNPARADSFPSWACGDNILLVNPNGDTNDSIRVVQDDCPGCIDGHIDAYISSPACQAKLTVDYGNFTVIRLR